MPQKPAKPEPRYTLTIAQLAEYDDVLTSALIDNLYFWTTIRKNRPTKFVPPRGLPEDEIARIIRDHIVLQKNATTAEEALLRLPAMRKFVDKQKDAKSKDEFKRHMRKYISIYLPDCAWEVTTTNRYTIFQHEASVTARRVIEKGETIKYLCGTQVQMTKDEEANVQQLRNDFSIVVSSRKKAMALFLGPARFANHDCNANARLMTNGMRGMTVVAAREIQPGEEVTVSYGDDYFGPGNCECLCRTCESKRRNGWLPSLGSEVPDETMSEENFLSPYSFRRKRRYALDSSASPIPEVPDIELPKRRKTASRLRFVSTAAETDNTSEQASEDAQERSQEAAVTGIDEVVEQILEDIVDEAVASVPEKAYREDSDISIAGDDDRVADAGVEVSGGTSTEDPPASGMRTPPTPTRHSALTTVETVINEAAGSQHIPPLQTLVTSGSGSELLHDLSASKQPTGISSHPHIGEFSMTNALSPPASVSTPNVLDVEATPSLPVCKVAMAAEQLADEKPNGNEVEVEHVIAMPSVETIDSDQMDLEENENPASHTPRAASQASASMELKERVPGDYMTHPALLVQAYSAWVTCLVCSGKFVQADAYVIKAYCQRCERHSKLYGYAWPKTDKENKWDTEERILDHRVVHKFISRKDEKRLRNGESESSSPEPAPKRRVARRRPVRSTTRAQTKAQTKAPVKDRKVVRVKPTKVRVILKSRARKQEEPRSKTVKNDTGRTKKTETTARARPVRSRTKVTARAVTPKAKPKAKPRRAVQKKVVAVKATRRVLPARSLNRRTGRIRKPRILD